MNSKSKAKIKQVVEQNRKLKEQRKKLVSALAAVVHQFGEVRISWEAAFKVDEDDQVAVIFNKEDGSFTIKLHGVDNAVAMGSGSEEIGVSGGEGDVVGPLPEGESVAVGGEVREGDQHNPKSFSVVRIADPESGGTEQHQGGDGPGVD